MKFTELRWLLIIAILAIIARAIFFFVLVPYNPTAQSRDNYLTIARNVVDHKGFTLSDDGTPTSKRTPVPVYYLAGVLWLLGDHTLSIAFVNWILEAITCILLYFIAIEIFGNKKIALTSALLYALYIPSMSYAWQALSEPLFTLLLTAFVLSFLRVLRLPSVAGVIIAGVFLGLATLTRPIMLYFLPIAVITLILSVRPRKAVIKWVFVFSLTFILVIMPWTIRNYVIFGEVVPLNTNIGITIYHSNHALGDPDFLTIRSTEEAEIRFRNLLQTRYGPDFEYTLHEYDRLAKEETLSIIQEYPGRYLLLSLKRFFTMWYYVLGPFSAQSAFVLLFHVSLIILTLIAFIFYRGAWWPQGLFLMILVLYNNAGYAAVQVSVRYIVPVVPYLILFAALVLVNFLESIRATWVRQPREVLER